jgi:hypothetical protein
MGGHFRCPGENIVDRTLDQREEVVINSTVDCETDRSFQCPYSG